MIETNQLFFGRIWCIQDYQGNSYYSVKLIEKCFRLLYLTKHKFYVIKDDAFKDIESGKYYPVDLNACAFEKFFINTNDIKSIRDVFPSVNFPSKLTRNQALQISELFNKMQCESFNKDDEIKSEIKNNTINLMNTKVLTKKIK